MVVACVALIVALGGSAYAVSALPKNSVGTKQLKGNSVTSPKVKDGSLRKKDFKTGDLPAGRPGTPGTARGYAEVKFDGTFDAARSKGVIDVRPPCASLPCTSPPPHAPNAAQCFKLSFVAKNAVATAGTSGATTIATVALPSAPPTPTFFDSCPAGYRAAQVYTVDIGNNPTAATFYVVFN